MRKVEENSGQSGDSGEKVSLKIMKIMNCFELGVSIVSIESEYECLFSHIQVSIKLFD